MTFQKAEPKDASAVILLRENSNEVFLACRNPKISFLGGFHAFPGGKVDQEDSQIEVENCSDESLKKFIVCAVRETFEEIGILLVRGGEKITKGQRASLHEDLSSGRFSFAEILRIWNLKIDAEDFQYTGFWTTPEFSPVRFKTRFFMAKCPRKQQPNVFGEFVAGDFIAPKDALLRWEKSEILIAPPVLISLQQLSRIKFENREIEIAEKDICENFYLSAAENLLSLSQKFDGVIRHIKIHPFINCFPVRTETLPPATHTNCFIVGGKEFSVIDAASPFAEEQIALHQYIDSLIESGCEIKELILTHLHRDHVSGVNALQKHLHEKFKIHVPIVAHKLTAESLREKISVEKFIEDGEILNFKTDDKNLFRLLALHTPGHARGHLCFYDEQRGFLLSGDNVVGTSSVLIAPPEGNMIDYLQSLERMKNLSGLHFLCGSHGAAIYDAKGKIETYILHRLEREKKILEAMNGGAKNLREIVEKVYADVVPELWNSAEKSVAAHLEKLQQENRISV